MSTPTTLLLYDGSFDGFLTCVFYIFEYKLTKYKIQIAAIPVSDLFAEPITVTTDNEKSHRVWKRFCMLTEKNTQVKVFKTFLSEIKGVENTLAYLLKKVLIAKEDLSNNYSDPQILKIQQVAKMVHREKHRMEAFIRFQKTKDNLYIATIEPDFNVIPLLINHFKDRYADQRWLIYDLKRKYGIYYDLNTVELTTVDFFTNHSFEIDENYLAEGEKDFQKLWSTYFESVNIKSRKNNKLHLQHVPKRYWKYLTEKTIPLR